MSQPAPPQIVIPTKEVVEQFCCSVLGLPYSKRMGQFGAYAPKYSLWEKDIISEYKRYSEDDLAKTVEPHGYGYPELKEFSAVFCRMMNNVFPVDLLSLEHHRYAKAVCMIFMCNLGENGSHNPQAAIAAFRENGNVPSRYYDRDYLFITAGSTLKHWLRTTAVWTVDMVLADIMQAA